jgi:hypothetical protein
MPRPSDAPIVASRGVERLLEAVGFGGDLEQALETGVIARRKVNGRWLYFEPDADVEEASAAVSEAAEEQLRAWLLSPTQYLRSPVARALGERVTADAVEAILPQLVHEGRFGALGLLTMQYQPYLAIFSWEDEDEVSRQVRSMKELLDRQGYVRQAGLPDPLRPREAAGWKSSVLKHGEFLGLGFIEEAALMGWDR